MAKASQPAQTAKTPQPTRAERKDQIRKEMDEVLNDRLRNAFGLDKVHPSGRRS